MRGVYFVANDVVFDNVVAFLNSLRLSNPDIPICFIPYTEEVTRVMELQEEYNFSVFIDPVLFARCDALSRQFHQGHTIGYYRKLAVWHGPFDEFAYIDVDTVVLQNLDFAFRFLSDYDFVAAVSDVPHTRHWTWLDSIDEVDLLTPKQKNFAANTGFICSRKGKLSIDIAEAAMPVALQLKPHMWELCAEQAFLNYLMVTSDLPYTSLYLQHLAGVKEVYFEHWAGQPLQHVAGKVLVPTRIFLVHWAGLWQQGRKVVQRVPNLSLWMYYRFLRHKQNEKIIAN